jgi:hypothetical protein
LVKTHDRVIKRTNLLIGAGVLWATAAAAQPAPDPAPAPVASADGTVVVPVEAMTPGWSEVVIERPLTLPAAKLALYGTLDIAHLKFTVPGGASTSVTSEALDLGVGYGVNDKLTVGGQYAFSIHDFEIKGPLTLFGAYSLLSKDKLTIGASANLTINFRGGSDATGNSTTTETLQAGLGVRYQVAPKVAIYSGGKPFPLGGGVANEMPMAGNVLGQHLSIGLNSKAPISFDVPVGVGIQASPQAFLWVNTSIAHLGLSNDKNAFLFADFIPLNVGLNYAVDKHLDVNAFLTLPDLKEAKFDLLFAGVGVRYYN